jgi:hypothetical protein
MKKGMAFCLAVCAALLQFYTADARLFAPIHGLKASCFMTLPRVILHLKGGQGEAEAQASGANDESLPDYNQNNPAEIPADLKEDVSPGKSEHDRKPVHP